MKRVLTLSFITICAAVSICGQEKGVDPQNGRIRDTGNDRAPANNGAKQDSGAGRGMDFGAGRTPEAPQIPNPYRFTSRRDVIIQNVNELVRDRGMILDEASSKPDEGVLVTQPYTFSKGAVVTVAELNRFTDLPPSTSRGWTRARYTLIIEVQLIDGVRANVAVTARIEGRTDGATGAEWVTLQSTGGAEQEFLKELIERITGGPPAVSEP